METIYDTKEVKHGFIIYVDKKKITVPSIDLQKKIVRLLLKNKIDPKNICVYDIADRYDIQSNIKAHCQKIPSYPYIEINGAFWGEGKYAEEKFEEIMELSKNLIKKPSPPQAPQQPNTDLPTTPTEEEMELPLSIGIVSKSIEYLECISFGLVKNLWTSFVSIEEIPKEESDFECELVKTNWYYRNQIRKYRFTPTTIFRVEDKQIKGELFYNKVTELKKTDNENIIIMFENKNDDQYLYGKKEVLDKIIEIVTSRAYLTPISENSWKSKVVGVKENQS